MGPDTSPLARAVAASFPSGERAAATALVEAYEGAERIRVQLAILALARGRLDDLERLVRAAALDYRDVLYGAEYPEESNSMTKAEAADRYRAIGAEVPPQLAPRRRKSRPPRST